MAHVCLHADECRMFIKNGKLRFQARKTGADDEVLEQVTISFPKEMVRYFTDVENLDAGSNELIADTAVAKNRIRGFMGDKDV